MSNKKNLTDKKFGKLIVIKENGKNYRGEILWSCKCECGSIKNIKSYNLVSGNTKSCGCIKTGVNPNPIYKIGETYFNLQVIGISRSKKHRCYIYKYKCKCGNIGNGYRKLSKNCPKCAAKFRKQKDYLKYGELPIYYFNRIILSAKKRKLDCTITIEYIWNLFLKQNRNCYYTGLDIYFSSPKNKQTASLDRIDSSKGYIENNVCWSHKDVNKMKMNFTKTRFIEICNKVSERFNARNLNVPQ